MRAGADPGSNAVPILALGSSLRITTSLHAMMPVRMADYSIGLDLGGTNLRAAAIDRSGRMLDKISGATNFTEGRDAVLSDIVEAISKLREKHGSGGLAG